MDDPQQVLALAVRLLARRDHSTAEIAQKLARRGVADAAAAAAIDRLRELGYLDDRRFAERWARSAAESGRGYGPRLRLELARRGIAAEIVAEVLTGIEAELDEESALAGLVARRFPDFDPGASSEREERRVIAYLQRRGFGYGTIRDFFRNREER